jgi:hypothetical protein
MKTDTDSNSRGLTRIEVVVIVAGLVLLVLLVLVGLPTLDLGHNMTRAERINCSNNLHQIALAADVWAEDHQGNYPAQVSGTNGGAREDAVHGLAAPVFEVMSNELNGPQILMCAADKKRYRAANFNSHLSNSNLSYFISLDATTNSDPLMFLAGDRNLQSSGVPLRSGALHTIFPTTAIGWTDELHHKNGNILVADGSVQQWSSAAIQTAVTNGMNTNRIDVP